jgi:phage-related protein
MGEFRAAGRDGIGRSLSVATTGRRVVILRTFIKKTQKTLRAEIESAFKRRGKEKRISPTPGEG